MNEDNTQEELYNRAKTYMGTKLNTRSGIWKNKKALEVDNCGFDILLALAYRDADHVGQAWGKNSAVCCAANTPAVWMIDWKLNIDGLVQHEISHLFGCYDRYDRESGILYHPDEDCIMFYYYFALDNWGNCLFEKIRANNGYNNPTNQWCTCESAQYDCTDEFEDNWNQYYKPDNSQ